MNAVKDQMAAITARIVEQIEAGADTWEMPWRSMVAGWPVNAKTGQRYTGGNVLTFSFAGVDKGYTSPRWATYKQWQQLDAQVRKGEKGTVGFFYSRTAVDCEKENEVGETETVTVTVPFLRLFYVFNAAQVDNDPSPDQVTELTSLERDARAEAFFGNVPASVQWGAGNPCYRLSSDQVIMPDFDAFVSASAAYATLAHELGHWTGHSSRLAREYGKRFGDHAYAAEELVAELSAAFTCALVGIDTVARSDHASYLSHWVRMLNENPSTLWSVASKAQAATDFLADYQPNVTSSAA